MTDEAKLIVNTLRACAVETQCSKCVVLCGNDECLFTAAAKMIESLSAELEQVKRERDAAAKCAKEFAARINAGEELTACEYCDKEFGTCNCNCMKEFEWRGVKE